MNTALFEKPSQAVFEKELRRRLASRERAESAVPDVRGVREGLDVAALDKLRTWLGLRDEVLEQVLSVSARTLQRRRTGNQRLTSSESDRLWRVLHIIHRAVGALGDEEAARTWLLTPKTLLGGESPLERLDTEPGLREIEDMLTVIDETAAA
jgi:putative toxin-antitoxin system antitoxin component (TIGR02293 family)